jgi:hypothetical protein
MNDRPSSKRGSAKPPRSAEPVQATDGRTTAPGAVRPSAAIDPDEIITSEPSSDRSDLGIVELNVPPGWKFYPLDDRIIGRPGNNVGGIHIVVLSSKKLPSRPTHEMLMSAARAACNYATSGPGADPAKERIEGYPAGGESFLSGRDFVRVWYHLRPEGLVVAWFACKSRRMVERAVKKLVHQSDKIVASIRLPSRADA